MNLTDAAARGLMDWNRAAALGRPPPSLIGEQAGGSAARRGAGTWIGPTGVDHLSNTIAPVEGHRLGTDAATSPPGFTKRSASNLPTEVSASLDAARPTPPASIGGARSPAGVAAAADAAQGQPRERWLSVWIWTPSVPVSSIVQRPVK